MKYIFDIKFKFLIVTLFIVSVIVSSCNKDVEQLGDITQPQRSGQTLDQLLKNNPEDSLYFRLIVKSGQLAMISDSNKMFSMFVPNNDAMRNAISSLAGIPNNQLIPNLVFSQFITSFISVEQAAALVQYNTIPQAIRTSSIPGTFPNFFYPSTLNPTPYDTIPYIPLARLDIYPSTRNGGWLNNLPLTSVNTLAYNGVIHHCAGLAIPPQRFLWNRINTDTGLTYLKAAIIRADSGTSPAFLQGALSNIGANLTLFAPTNAAFKKALVKMIAQVLIRNGADTTTAINTASALSSSPDVFSNPLLFSALPAEQVKGLLAYHLLGSRAFTNNFSTSPESANTLLGFPVILKATFGNPFVTSATVKGSGNAVPANIIINTTPLTADPDGTSDQLYLNGIMHEIDDILMPY